MALQTEAVRATQPLAHGADRSTAPSAGLAPGLPLTANEAPTRGSKRTMGLVLICDVCGGATAVEHGSREAWEHAARRLG